LNFLLGAPWGGFTVRFAQGAENAKPEVKRWLVGFGSGDGFEPNAIQPSPLPKSLTTLGGDLLMTSRGNAMSIDNHLYVILFPNTALVGSQLDPQEFGKHFISGSSKYYAGKLIFAEVNIGFRHSYFKIDEMLADLRPHADGRPKSTKYVSTYRVLEHLDFEAIKNLYITTPEGYTLELKTGAYEASHQPGLIRIFGEISPVSMMVLSDYNFLEFSKHITDPESFVGAPKMFYTQIDLDVDEFLVQIDANPLMPPPIPDIHPAVLSKSILEIRKFKDKHTKGLSLSNPLGKISFKNLRHGFMFASQEKNKFFPLPGLGEIEKTNYKFWKYM